jgi:hypothetical protein
MHNAQRFNDDIFQNLHRCDFASNSPNNVTINNTTVYQLRALHMPAGKRLFSKGISDVICDFLPLSKASEMDVERLYLQ